jgi:hypothetical protein
VEGSVKEAKPDERLGEYRQQFTEFVDNSLTERNEAERHRDFYDGKQWTAEEENTLKARGQPVITDNKIKDKVEYMEGVERKTRSDPKAFPRTPQHEQDADVATDAIRYVFDKNRFPVTKSAVFQNLLIEGFGGCEVIVDKDNPKEILIRKYRWDRLYRDPYSMEPDCSDANYRGIITWMDSSKAEEKWPERKESINSTMSNAPRSSGETQDDKPRWADTKRKRVQVFEHYSKEGGTIVRSVWCWGGFLEDPEECPYLDDQGEHEDPMVLQSAYIDREGKRYGIVARYLSLQEELNKRRSKSLHLLNTKQLIAEKGAFDDIKEARKELHKPDGVLEPNPGLEWEIEKNLDLSEGHFKLLVQAEAALSVTGPNQALQGNTGSLSGRAKELDQQGGAIQIGVLFDSIRDWQLRVARAVWNRIRQYWDEEMWIRVTDDEYGVKFVPINKRQTYGELAAEKLKGQPPEQIQQQVAQIAQDPMSQQFATDAQGKPVLKNPVAQLDVDIIIDEAPDVITIQAEEFAKLADLATAGVGIPPDALIEAAQLRSQTKKKILDKMSGANDPAAQQRAQMAQFLEKLEVMLKQAEVRKANAQATKDEVAAKEGEVDAAVKVATFVTKPAQPKTQVGVN